MFVLQIFNQSTNNTFANKQEYLPIIFGHFFHPAHSYSRPTHLLVLMKSTSLPDDELLNYG